MQLRRFHHCLLLLPILPQQSGSTSTHRIWLSGALLLLSYIDHKRSLYNDTDEEWRGQQWGNEEDNEEEWGERREEWGGMRRNDEEWWGMRRTMMRRNEEEHDEEEWGGKGRGGMRRTTMMRNEEDKDEEEWGGKRWGVYVDATLIFEHWAGSVVECETE